MRITELVNNLDIGGTERMVVDLTLALQAKGHELRVVCLRQAGALAPVLQRAGVEVMALDKPEGPRPETLWRLVRYLRKTKTEVVHTHNPLVHHYGVFGGRLAGTPVIVSTIHGLGNIAQRPGLKELLYSASCRLSSSVVAVCPMAYRTFATGKVIPKSKLVAINNGIPLETLLQIPDREPHPATVFGIVGRLVPVKDHRSLLEAFVTVLSERPECRLEILGDGPMRAELEEQASRSGIAQRVTFHGFSADVAGFLARVDAVVLCSTSEGLPLSVLEAMAAGLPVVGTDVGGVRDLVEGAAGGWLCPPSDPAALAAALLAAAAATPAERREMGARARRHVVDYYSLERMADEYERLFTELGTGTALRAGADPAGR